jgi:hypothetical protein
MTFTTKRYQTGRGKWNARLYMDGLLLSDRAFLRDVSESTNSRRLSDLRKDIKGGYTFPILRERRARLLGHR